MTKIVEKQLKSNEIIPMTYDLMFTEIFNNEKNIVLLEEFISFYMNIPIKEVTGNLKLKITDTSVNINNMAPIRSSNYETEAFKKELHEYRNGKNYGKEEKDSDRK